MKRKNIWIWSRLYALGLIVAAVVSMPGCMILAPVTAATTGMVALDERSAGTVIDDAVIISKVKKEFASNGNVDAIFTKVSVNAYEGRVLLSGTVKKEEYKEEATKAAWSVHGVKEVINVVHIAPLPESKANDAWITSQINTKFLAEPHFDSLNYKVDVNDGIVYLLGLAQNQDELDRALSIASTTSGVKKVESYILLKSDRRSERRK